MLCKCTSQVWTKLKQIWTFLETKNECNREKILTKLIALLASYWQINFNIDVHSNAIQVELVYPQISYLWLLLCWTHVQPAPTPPEPSERNWSCALVPSGGLWGGSGLKKVSIVYPCKSAIFCISRGIKKKIPKPHLYVFSYLQLGIIPHCALEPMVIFFRFPLPCGNG